MRRVAGMVIAALIFYASFQVASAQARGNSPRPHPGVAGLLDNTSHVQQDTARALQDTVPVLVPRDAVDTLNISTAPSGTAPPDTLIVVEGAGARNDSVEKKVDSVLLATSSDALFAPAHLFKPNPTKAVIYSAIFPGLGQIYNRKYWKLPIVYGGFVGFTYAITWNHGYYRDYLEGYKSIMDENPENDHHWHDLLPYGMDPESVDQQWLTGVLQQRKDYYRHYRDLSIILTVGWYLLAMVDAYVDAQLFDFDMSPDLSLRVEPAIWGDDASPYRRNSYGLQWSFRF